MSELVFKSRQGSFTAREASVQLLQWYANKTEPNLARWRDAAIEELSRREPDADAGVPAREPPPEVIKPAPEPSRRQTQRDPEPQSTAIVATPKGLQPFVSTEASFINAQLARVAECCHLITPTTMFGELPQGYSAQLTVVQINKDDDCVKIESNFMLSAATLKRVSTAAGLSPVIEHTKRIDDRSIRNLWEFQAVLEYTDIDLEKRNVSGVYEMDLRDDSPRLNEIWAKADRNACLDADDELKNQKFATDADADAKWNELYELALRKRNLAAEKEIDGLRKNGLTRAETGAKSRAIAELIKRSQKGAGAWQKPIACVRLIRQNQAIDSVNKLYPPATTPQVFEGSFEDEQGDKANE